MAVVTSECILRNNKSQARGFLLGAQKIRGPTVDGQNPALPIIRNIP